MLFERSEDVERGLRLIPQLGEVMPDEAGEGVRAVYEETRTHLRVPVVNFLFRSLANYPPYLSFAWNKIAPHLLTPRFEEAADTLRARALVEPIYEPTDWTSLQQTGHPQVILSRYEPSPTRFITSCPNSCSSRAP